MPTQILDPASIYRQLQQSGTVLTPPPPRRGLETRNDPLPDSTQMRSGLTGSFPVGSATATFRSGLLISIS